MFSFNSVVAFIETGHSVRCMYVKIRIAYVLFSSGGTGFDFAGFGSGRVSEFGFRVGSGST